MKLKQSKSCGSMLAANAVDYYWRWPKECKGLENLVVLTQIFAHELSFSYSRPWRRVLSYNEIKIKSLAHLQQLWNESCSEVEQRSKEIDSRSAEEGNGDSKKLSFVRLGLENDDDIVFEVEAAIKAQTEVMATHSISKPFCILPPNPKYV